jgi:hypothetical protein
MIQRITYACLLASLLACGTKKTETPAVDSTAVKPEAAAPAPSPAAQLSEADSAAGYKLLFDGQTLNGWKYFKDKSSDSWEVADGTLHCKPFVDGRENQRADIMTIDEYANFELAFDWKISTQGNSGVMFRVTEENDQPYLSGPEFQLIDNEGYPGDLKPEQFAGANYDMHAAPDAKAKPVGEWNEARLVVNGNHVEHWLNGAKVVEYELGSADWKKRKAKSKWNDAKNYGAAKTGHIDFQDHNHEAWFRNIRIKALS